MTELQAMKKANVQLKHHNLRIKWSYDYQEFSVNWTRSAGGCSETEYFTDDIDDAIGTAQHMIKERQTLEPLD